MPVVQKRAASVVLDSVDERKHRRRGLHHQIANGDVIDWRGFSNHCPAALPPGSVGSSLFGSATTFAHLYEHAHVNLLRWVANMDVSDESRPTWLLNLHVYVCCRAYEEQRDTLHAELELIQKGAGESLIQKLEAQVAEEEEAARQKLEMERMERDFMADEE